MGRIPLKLLIVLILLVMVACTGGEKSVDAGGSDPGPPIPEVPYVDMAGTPVYVPPGPARQDDVPENLLEVIQEGIALMESTHLEKSKCGGKRLGWKKCLGDYLIAASDSDGNVIQVEAYENSPSSPANFSVRCERNDGACDVGVNVPLIVEAPPGWTVVALRTAVWDKKGPGGISGAVYVPYSSRLDTPELRLAGLEYLTQAVSQAHQELVDIGVPSQYISGTMATDWGTPEHVLTLTLTEQMRSDLHFVEGDDSVRTEMLNRSLVILGANQAGTSRYSRSRVGAAGLMQLMPRTYKSLRRLYPAAALLQDTVEGRVNHNSAIRAAIVHTDSEWWTFRGADETSHREFLMSHPYERGLVFAAGYNANVDRVNKAIDQCGANWRDESCKKFPSETRRYLIKYEWINRVLFDPEPLALDQKFVAPSDEDHYDHLSCVADPTQ